MVQHLGYHLDIWFTASSRLSKPTTSPGDMLSQLLPAKKVFSAQRQPAQTQAVPTIEAWQA